MCASSPRPVVGSLFPVGGPVSADMMIGRAGDVAEVVHRVRQGVHSVLVGPRRIGKTTVCDAACERVGDELLVLGKIEVPVRGDARDFLRSLAEAVAQASAPRQGAARVARALAPLALPVLQQLIHSDLGVDVDLSALGQASAPQARREVLGLPLALAARREQQVVLYLDEVQRIAAYDRGSEVLHDLVDLYSGQADVVVLMDGSEERTIENLLVAPVDLGKLAQRLSIEPTIPEEDWRPALRERFSRLDHPLERDAEDDLLLFGQGRPLHTMAAAQGAALTASMLEPGVPVDRELVALGLRLARERLSSLD